MKHIYEVGPINFFNLSEAEQNGVLSKFASALKQLNSPIVFHIRLGSMALVVGTELYNVKHRRYFIESDQPLGGFLATMGLSARYGEVMEMPRYEVVKSLPRYAVLEDGDLVKAYSLTGLSSELEHAFLARVVGESSILEMTDELRMRIEPMAWSDSKGLIRLHADTMQAKLFLIESSGGRDRELEQEVRRAEEAAQAVMSGAQRLYRLSCVFVVRGKNLEELRTKANDFWDIITGVVTEIDSPKGAQEALVTSEGPEYLQGGKILLPADSVLAFFPFAGLEIIERNGVYLGFNLQTGGPIVYNPYGKENPHIAIVGTTGAGKSMLIKCWLSRMALNYPDLAFIIFDGTVKASEYARGPDGSYEHGFAGLAGAKVLKFTPGEPLGLDPIRLFPRRQAASLLAMIANVGEGEHDLRAELYSLAQDEQRVSCVGDFYGSHMSEQLRRRLDAHLKPVNFIFEGEPQKPYLRTIFSFEDLPKEAKGPMVVLASALSMLALRSLPREQKKVLVIDEAWAFLASDEKGRPYFSEATTVVEEMARVGRSSNISLLFATQEGRDLMSGSGVRVLELCATRVLLHQNGAGQGGAADLAAHLFGLSDQERAFVDDAGPGFGILFTSEGRVLFHNELKGDEAEVFTTNAEEAGKMARKYQREAEEEPGQPV